MRSVGYEGTNGKGVPTSHDRRFLEWLLNHVATDYGLDAPLDMYWYAYSSDTPEERREKVRSFEGRKGDVSRIPWLWMVDCDHDHLSQSLSAAQHARRIHARRVASRRSLKVPESEIWRFIVPCNEMESWMAAFATPDSVAATVRGMGITGRGRDVRRLKDTVCVADTTLVRKQDLMECFQRVTRGKTGYGTYGAFLQQLYSAGRSLEDAALRNGSLALAIPTFERFLREPLPPF